MAQRNIFPVDVQKVWLCVLKTSDLVGPRRHPERPRVVVKSLTKRPGLELDRWVKVSPRARRMRVVNVVYEAMPGPSQPGGRDSPLLRPTQREVIKEVEKKLRQRLQCDGYTVNGDLTVWHLYVIELSAPGGQSSQQASAGYLYVGQTSQPLEDRIRQHREGYRNLRGQRLHSQTCHRRFVRPRFDLLPQDFMQTFFCQQDALTAESDLRIALESIGYVVEGGTEQLARRRHDLGLAE